MIVKLVRHDGFDTTERNLETYSRALIMFEEIGENGSGLVYIDPTEVCAYRGTMINDTWVNEKMILLKRKERL